MIQHRSKPPQEESSNPWDPDVLRTQFVQALSDMYRTEVPLYGDLVEIVNSVDDSVLLSRQQQICPSIPQSQDTQQQKNDLFPARHHRLERHGAIRLGTQHEMHTIGRLFALLGMFPVGYYDLSVPSVGFPLHGTAFRPVSEASLQKNPFRVFCTVLRADLIPSTSVRETSVRILGGRKLFTGALVALMDRAETEGTDGLSAQEAQTLIAESLRIFKWHSRSTVPLEIYRQLRDQHPIVADIVCFPSAHINHLTPRTLDIDAVQAEMVRRGLPAKESIEGPPGGRKCEILLRQTSFRALEERVVFPDEGEGVDGTHTARFGEVEQRGAAVTRRGRDLYDKLLGRAVDAHQSGKGDDGGEYSDVLAGLFKAYYPDDWTELRRQGLVFFRYRARKDIGDLSLGLAADGGKLKPLQMEDLLSKGVVECEPITYEDFLPFSAAGIFRSNLGDGRESPDAASSSGDEANSDGSRKELEGLLGRSIPSEIDLYEKLQCDSIAECERLLGLKEGQIVL